MVFLCDMVTTTYISDDDKIKLLRDTVNYIWNNMRVQLTQNDSDATRTYFTSAEFRQFTGAIDDVKQMLRFPFDETKVIKLASSAIESWNFALKFATREGEDFTYHVSLLKQIIDLFKNHHDDVWTKEDGQKIYNRTQREHFMFHPHHAAKAHSPRAPEPPEEPVESGGEPAEQPVDAESMASLHLNALLLQLKDLCK